MKNYIHEINILAHEAAEAADNIIFVFNSINYAEDFREEMNIKTLVETIKLMIHHLFNYIDNSEIGDLKNFKFVHKELSKSLVNMASDLLERIEYAIELENRKSKVIINV